MERAGVACKARSIDSGMRTREGIPAGFAESEAGGRMSWGNSIISGQ